ncbi:SMC-Scp complex subunit ScpB [Membranihabitans maritimus]|uniref:SMC-Scp complex subunit ScpB n=1 Tax=Membranihabitans maritimus TaxID=2904244 RepID=UPI001F029FB3|nr:SMC-Scp complex subunit ScpB [Membranihabitans maritimus]
MDPLGKHIETLIFIANPAISFEEILDCLETKFEERPNESMVSEIIDHLVKKYSSSAYSFEIVEMNNGFRFMTKSAYFDTVSTYLKQISNKKLSTAALETLSIIAYKQPVTKSEIEQIRGVNCDYTVQKLLDKELITVLGRSEKIGKPLLYGTSDKFVDYFGLKDIKDLPKLKDFEDKKQVIGNDSYVAEEAFKTANENKN